MSWFSKKEMQCKCKNDCGFNTFDYELLEVLNDLREHMGIPIIIVSGNRCYSHNRSVNGADKSRHLYGCAADIRPNLNEVLFEDRLNEMHQYLLEKYPNQYGIALGSSFVHIDTRSNKARWKY